MIYLLKLTLAWSLFLLLFEAMYKNNGRFAANRTYLLLSMAAGLLLPLLQLPAIAAQIPVVPVPVFQAASSMPAFSAVAQPGTTAPPTGFPYSLVITGIYSLGFALILGRSFIEWIRIARLVRRAGQHVIAGSKVVITGRRHAPFSFMGRIFLTDPAAYTPRELDYIIRHEAAHNHKWHGADLLLLHLLCIVFWFHPLVWRYRFLLQLQHEYEADALAARDDTYAYGHFLLQQALFGGVPSIAHSFHFSPIKNRINMLTKKQNRNSGAWKYLFLIPAALGCTFIMAKTAGNPDRVRRGDVTTYDGNTFKWRQSITGGVSGRIRYSGTPGQSVFEMNGEPVYQNEYLKTPAVFGTEKMDYSEYLVREFSKVRKTLPDSLTSVAVVDMVINKYGKAVYYDLKAVRPDSYFQNAWHPYGDQEPALNKIMDRIIRESPDWKPAMFEGKPVNTFIKLGGGC